MPSAQHATNQIAPARSQHTEAIQVILVVGLVAGWLAGFGFIGDIAIGIVGAFIGDWLLPQIGIHLGKELSRQSSTPEEPTIVAVDIPIGLPAPETGAALVSGQWRTFKTTVALDVSVCVMADLLFAGRHRVKRRRAVLYIALEGESMLAARLSAIAGHRGVRGPLPFVRRLRNVYATTKRSSRLRFRSIASLRANSCHTVF